MSSKTKPTKATKKAEAREELPKYSYEFLDMLIDTAFLTVGEHLKKKGLPREAELVDLAYCLVIESTSFLEGGEPDNDSLPLYVMKVIHYISEFGGEWYSPTGRVMPLQERLAAKRARGKS